MVQVYFLILKLLICAQDIRDMSILSRLKVLHPLILSHDFDMLLDKFINIITYCPTPIQRTVGLSWHLLPKFQITHGVYLLSPNICPWIYWRCRPVIWRCIVIKSFPTNCSPKCNIILVNFVCVKVKYQIILVVGKKFWRDSIIFLNSLRFWNFPPVFLETERTLLAKVGCNRLF